MKYKQNLDNAEHFSQNNIEIRIKCPECIRTIKGKNHVKVYKNLSGLWRHIKTEHGEIINSQFNTDEITSMLKIISKALNLGLSSSDIAKICKASHLGMLSYN